MTTALTALIAPSYEQAQAYRAASDIGEATTILTDTRFVPTGLVLRAEDIVFVEGWKLGEHAAYIEDWLRLVISTGRVEDCAGWTGPTSPAPDTIQLTDVRRLALQPDDTIVLRLAAPADAGIAEQIGQHMRATFPDHRCIVLSPGSDIEVITKDGPDFAAWAEAETLAGQHAGVRHQAA